MNSQPPKLLWFYLILSWYGLGAALVESLVNYPSWRLISEESFVAYHQFLAFRITFVLVFPLLIQAGLAAYLWWQDKKNVSLILQNLMHLIFWVASATLQIPIQGHLDTLGKDMDLLNTLILSDLWWRTLPHIVQTLLATETCVKGLTRVK